MKWQESPASVWSEEELLNGERVRCLTIILKTPGCAWWRKSGGCSMCGYNEKSSDKSITGDDVMSQFDAAWKSFSNHSIVKIYTSGSFLDECEVPLNIRENILGRVGESGVKMLFETRPEFVKSETIAGCVHICPDLEVALGLESGNDKILSKSIQKGFSFSDYERSANSILASGATVRTYLLLKPPFITEKEAISDTLASIEMAARFSRVITINPVNVQRRTRLERIWKSWSYRPPWLWSLTEVLRKADAGNSLLLASLVGAGSDRGAHNCGACDPELISSIEGFNLTQDRARLDKISCGCIGRWREMLSIEEFSISAGDHEKFFMR